jgi:4'-phosphopantetheinyl transferase
MNVALSGSNRTEETCMPLRNDEVHVWYLAVEPGSHNWALERREILSEREEDRRTRFVFEKDRRLFLASHVLVRSVLSKYAAIPPAEWSFAEHDNGKPFIIGPDGATLLRFNLSHTRGMAAIAVALDLEVGIDVEQISGSDDEHLAKTCFTEAERRGLDSLPEMERLDRFFDLWTLKEAYLKARGTGLSTPLQEFSVTPQGMTDASIAFTSAINDHPASWQFHRYRPSESHRLAVAVRRDSAQPMHVRLYNAQNE